MTTKIEFKFKGKEYRFGEAAFDGKKLRRVSVEKKIAGEYWFQFHLFRPHRAGQKRPYIIQFSSPGLEEKNRLAREFARAFPYRTLKMLFPKGE